MKFICNKIYLLNSSSTAAKSFVGGCNTNEMLDEGLSEWCRLSLSSHCKKVVVSNLGPAVWSLCSRFPVVLSLVSLLISDRSIGRSYIRAGDGHLIALTWSWGHTACCLGKLMLSFTTSITASAGKQKLLSFYGWTLGRILIVFCGELWLWYLTWFNWF